MKKTLSLFTGFLLMVAASFAQAGWAPAMSSLAGYVTDSATGKPLAGCSVYLNSTSIGTVTAADGSFLLRNVPAGRSELIISAVGYRTYVSVTRPLSEKSTAVTCHRN
jgi:hypothetical protein